MKPFAWSYSALTRFETCPKQYYHLNVKKDIKDTYGSKQGDDGDAIHKALFARVTKGNPLPLAFRQYEKIAKRFADAEGEKHGELKLALNHDFEPCDFFAPDVFVRAILDLAIIRGNKALVIDWKTGKIKPDFTQLALASAVLQQYMPELEEFHCAFVWLRHNNVSLEKYTSAQIKEVWADMVRRAGQVEEAIKVGEFPMKPSGLCRGYCPVKTCVNYEERD